MSPTLIDEIETRLVDFGSKRLCPGLEDEVRFNKVYGRIWRGGCLERGCMLIICLKSPGLRPYKASGKPKQSWLWGNFTGNDTKNGLLMLGGQVGPMTYNSAGWVEKSRFQPGLWGRDHWWQAYRVWLQPETAMSAPVSASHKDQKQTPGGNNRACSWPSRMAQGQDHYSSGVHGQSSCV